MMYDELIEKERQLFKEEGCKYDRLVLLGRKVHQPTVVPLWNLKVTSADGDVLVNRDSYGHSFIRVLYNAHTQFSLFRRRLDHNAPIPSTAVEGGLGLREIGGTVNTLGFRQDTGPEPGVFSGGYSAEAAITTQGFVAGTGTTSEDFEDFVVEGLIGHGVGGGQLSYAKATLVKGWDAGDRFKFAQWSRVLTNSSGATITVGNVAMYFATIDATYCFTRDIISPPQDVLNTEVLTFTYEFRMYFP